MSVRPAQNRVLQQLQTLTNSCGQPSKAWSFFKQYLTASGSAQTRLCNDSTCGRQHQMTTTDPATQQSRSQADALQMSPDSQLSTSSMLPASKMSADCRLQRPVSNKSAKRKAAEALLAARYSCSTTGSSLATVAVGCSPLATGTSATAAASKHQVKRLKCMLASAIVKLGDTTGAAAAAVASSAAEHESNARQHELPQLSNLENMLHKLQKQHQQVQQQRSGAAAEALQHGQQQHWQQVQQQPPVHQQLQILHRMQLPDNVLLQQQQLLQQQHKQQLHGDRPVYQPLAASMPQLQQVVVPACPSDCQHKLAHGWCHTQVCLPHVDWASVLDADLSSVPSLRVASGYQRLQLPDGLQVLVIENQVHLPSALQQLRASMQDPIIAVDLEWRPEFNNRFTPVAMLQLASSSMAVLIRTCRMSYRLPPVLSEFLRDPSTSLVGFGWSTSDEPKMQSTFGIGAKDFGNFLDLQLVAQSLGYCGFGLARMTKHVLGLHLPKSKKISMSNWEALNLSHNQVKYAALDVLVAGQVFRALRLWHSSPSPCEVCHYNLGSQNPSLWYVCSCGKDFKDVKGYLQHCERAGHQPEWQECNGCGCARPLPWLSSGTSSSNSSAGGEGSSSRERQKTEHQ